MHESGRLVGGNRLPRGDLKSAIGTNLPIEMQRAAAAWASHAQLVAAIRANGKILLHGFWQREQLGAESVTPVRAMERTIK